MKRILIMLVFAAAATAANTYTKVRGVYKSPVYEDYCESASDWVGYRATLANVNTLDTEVRWWSSTQNSIKVTKTNEGLSGYIGKDFTAGAAKDFSACELEISYYIPPTYTASDFTVIQIQLINTTTTNYVRIEMVVPASTHLLGWQHIKIPLRHLTVGNTSTNGDYMLALTACRYFRVQITTSATEHTPYFILDMVRFIPYQDACHYAITLDDGDIGSIKACEYINSKGLRATLCVNGGNHNATPGAKMSIAQLQMLQRRGNLIINHGYAHLYPQAGQADSPGKYFDDIIDNAEWLIDNGMGRGAYLWATAGGIATFRDLTDYDQRQITKYVPLIRSAAPLKPLMSGFWDQYGWGKIVYCIAFDNNATANSYLTDYIMGGHPLIVTGYHARYDEGTYEAVVDANGDLIDAFKTHIDNVASAKAAGKLVDITLDQLVMEALTIQTYDSLGNPK